MKKLAMLLAVLMLAVAAFSVSAFEDVTVDNACFEAVNTLVSLDVIKGKTETTFAPDDLVTREQMAMLFTRLYTTVNFENGENYTPFADLDDPYYNSVIAWCYDAKVINGTSATTFEPKGNIIYQDALTMACRLLGYTDLTYPLGNITKARLIGLCDGLEGTAYDKELTRGEVAIILYNALVAEGAEVIKENKVKYYNGYPILESVERNFVIANDVYKFKSETYQVVGTENFNLTGYAAASNDSSYVLVAVDEDGARVGAAKEYAFEDLAIAEGTGSDAAILAFIDILYRGESLDDKKAVILSAVVNSDLENKAEVGVYYKKNSTTGKFVAQNDKISVNGKAVDVNGLVYAIDANGVIAPVASVDATNTPVFFQADQNDAGKYAQLVYDVNKDGEVDYVIFFPMEIQKVTGLTTAGKYTLKNMATNASVSFETAKEDVQNLLVLNTEVEKNDIVLTYKLGKFTVVEEVLEPVITTVTRKTGNATAGYKYGLATGDVVTFAAAKNPLLATVAGQATTLTPSIDEVALYIVNGKVVYTDDAVAGGYDAYKYAFYVSKGDTETSVNVEDGTIETVYSLIAFLDGKAATIPVLESAVSQFTAPGVMTITDIKDGKYIVDPTMKVNTATNDNGYAYEIAADNFWYDNGSKVYKASANGKVYFLNITEDSEFYVESKTQEGKYESVKRYTMANMPRLARDYSEVDNAIIAIIFDAEGKPTNSANLVVAYSDNGAGWGDAEASGDYRIVLSSGVEVNAKNEKFLVYEVLNPVTGAIENIIDEVTAVESAIAEANLVRKNITGKVEVVANSDAVFNQQHVASTKEVLKYLQFAEIVDNRLAVVYRGTTATDVATGAGDYAAELNVEGANIVVLDINDDGEFEITTTDDLSVLEGKVVRTYAGNDTSYKCRYIVVVPYEWAQAKGFTDLSAYDEYVDVIA